jgi:hypothetical protein
MERQVGPRSAGQVAGRDDELVRHQIVTDEGDPTVDPRVIIREVEHDSLPCEHLGDRAGPRQAGHVGTP